MTRLLIPRTRHWPQPLGSFSREMESLMEQFFGVRNGGLAETDEFLPSTNLAETESDIEVTVDIPGVKPDDIQIELREGNLLISGQRKEEKEEKGKQFHRIERSYGEFRRMISLPCAVDEEKIDAKYTDGVLRITLPKSEKVKPKKIQVKT